MPQNDLGNIFRQTLPYVLAAGATARVDGRTTILALFSATDPSKVSVSFDGVTYSTLPPNYIVRNMQGVEWFWVRNDDAVSNTIILNVGTADLFIPSPSTVDVNLTEVGGAAISLGPKAPAASIPVVTAGASACDAATAFTSLVDAQLLAANANRRGFTVWNEGAGILYLSLGTAAASLTNYTVQIAAGGYYEAPFGYTGEVRGIFGAAGTARVKELT